MASFDSREHLQHTYTFAVEITATGPSGLFFGHLRRFRIKQEVRLLSSKPVLGCNETRVRGGGGGGGGWEGNGLFKECRAADGDKDSFDAATSTAYDRSDQRLYPIQSHAAK